MGPPPSAGALLSASPGSAVSIPLSTPTSAKLFSLFAVCPRCEQNVNLRRSESAAILIPPGPGSAPGTQAAFSKYSLTSPFGYMVPSLFLALGPPPVEGKALWCTPPPKGSVVCALGELRGDLHGDVATLPGCSFPSQTARPCF